MHESVNVAARVAGNNHSPLDAAARTRHAEVLAWAVRTSPRNGFGGEFVDVGSAASTMR